MLTHPRRDLKAEGMLILPTLIWGGTFAVIKTALGDISPLLMVGIRFLLAALLAAPILLRAGGGSPSGSGPAEDSRPSRGLVRHFTPAAWGWGVVIGLGMLLGYAGQTIGLKYTTVARSGFITYSFALLVPFLQFLLLKKRPGWGNLMGLFVVFWGFSFIVDPSTAPLRFRELSPFRMLGMVENLGAGGLNIGDVYSLIGAVGYAFYVVFLDRATREVHPGAVTVIQMFVCGILALGLSPLVETPVLVPTWRLAGAMLYLIALGSILALALMNWFQRRLTPLRAVLIYATEPVFAAIIGFLVFGAGMSVREISGAVLILGGIVVSDIWNIIAAGRRNRRGPKGPAVS